LWAGEDIKREGELETLSQNCDFAAARAVFLRVVILYAVRIRDKPGNFTASVALVCATAGTERN
tara:strand:+ start:258 stop:449 length:192 start_codon:yes stop_codon:yes gene_type:complete